MNEVTYYIEPRKQRILLIGFSLTLAIFTLFTWPSGIVWWWLFCWFIVLFAMSSNTQFVIQDDQQVLVVTNTYVWGLIRRQKWIQFNQLKDVLVYERDDNEYEICIRRYKGFKIYYKNDAGKKAKSHIEETARLLAERLGIPFSSNIKKR